MSGHALYTHLSSLYLMLLGPRANWFDVSLNALCTFTSLIGSQVRSGGVEGWCPGEFGLGAESVGRSICRGYPPIVAGYQ